MNKVRIRLLAAGLVLVAGLSACSSKDSPTSPGTPVDTTASHHQTASGDSALAAGDIADANAHYAQALANDPSNTQARFGVAVTGVYLVQNDPEVHDLLGYLGNPPIPAPNGIRTPASSGLSRVTAALVPSGVDFTPIAEGRAVARLLTMAVTNPPAISHVQHVIRTKVMPKLQEAMNHMALIEADPNFVFILPPTVTGAPDTLEIDLGDVYLLDSAVHGVQGFVGMVVAYNFDVPNSDFDHVKPDSLLAPGTAWAALNTLTGPAGLSGAVVLGESKQNLLAVKAKLDAAVASINAETDDQSNDVVPQAAIAAQGFQDMLAGVTQVTASLQGAITISVNDAQHQPFAVQINVGRFFVPAIQDLKTKLPSHTFGVNGDPQLSLPITFFDPTINNIFPDMTNARWQQLTGLVPPPTAAR